MRASGVMPSSFALVSLITTTAAAPSLSGHALPAVTSPSGRNTGLSVASFSTVVPARGPSSLRHDGAVGERDRRDLPLEEAVLLRGDRALLRPHRELVHLLAADALDLAHVLRGLTHRDVDVGETGRRRPRRLAALGAQLGALACASPNFALGGPVSAAPFWKRLTVSTPPAMNTSPSPALIACAAMRIVCSDDEQ